MCHKHHLFPEKMKILEQNNLCVTTCNNDEILFHKAQLLLVTNPAT